MTERKTTFKPVFFISETKMFNIGLVLGTLNMYEAEMKRHNKVA